MKSLLTICLAFISFAVCPAGALTLVDLAGRQVRVPDNPRRVISLAPNITEIVFSLGQGGRLVGVSQYSNAPPAAQVLPKVGSYVRLDMEKIVALRPDLCLATKDGNSRRTVERLGALGIPVYVIDPHNLNDIVTVVERYGELLGVRQKAGELARGMRRRIERVRSKAALAKTRPAVFFQLDSAPLVSAGTNTYINELIVMAGGRNVAAGDFAYPRFSWEDILALAPEVVIITSMAGGRTAAELEADWRRWPQVPAVRDHRISVVEANLFDRPAIGLVDGLESLIRIIHPELF